MMGDFTAISIILALAGFIVGWIGSEAYTFYKHSKDKRWR